MKNRILQHRRFLLYCVIGGCGATLTCLVYAALVKFAGLDYQLANAIGYVAGTILSFLLNYHYNFQVTDRPVRRFAAFFAVALVGLAASAGLLRILVGRYHFDVYFSYLIVIFVVALLQYNLNRLLSFRKTN